MIFLLQTGIARITMSLTWCPQRIAKIEAEPLLFIGEEKGRSASASLWEAYTCLGEWVALGGAVP